MFSMISCAHVTKPVAGTISHCAVLGASSHSSGLLANPPYYLQIFIFARISSFFFFDDFSTTNFLTFFLKKRGSIAGSGLVSTASRSNHPLMGIYMVLYGWSVTGMQGTTLLSSLMESGMDMKSGMVLLVMCRRNGTTYGIMCSTGTRVPPTVGLQPTPLTARG